MTGEAYFEVAADPLRPFMVKTNDLVVNVLGTNFNIMAYPEENAVKATLLQGAISVSSSGKTLKILPGQQAVVAQGIEVRKVDTAKVMGWREGYFIFDGENIKTIMYAVGRWYNADIKFDDKITDRRLSARISRQTSISDVLEVLRSSGYNVRLEGARTIHVLQ
jgi:ferric-dicitrate binding protein FerR (iron transport regulator)